MAVSRVTRSSGTSRTRPTSLIAALAAMVPNVPIWATRLLAVLLADIVDDFLAAVLAEVDVDIGRLAAVRIEEALEQQIVFERADVAQLQDVADDGAARGAAGAGGDVLADGEADEIPDDEEIARKAHLADDAELVFEPFLRDCHACCASGGVRAVAFLQADLAQFAQVFFGRLLLGRREDREVPFLEIELDVALVGDFLAALDRGFLTGEELIHLLRRPRRRTDRCRSACGSRP